MKNGKLFMRSLSIQSMKVAVRDRKREPQRARVIARWREAERYFKQERDGKLPVTLPRVKWLEDKPVT